MRNKTGQQTACNKSTNYFRVSRERLDAQVQSVKRSINGNRLQPQIKSNETFYLNDHKRIIYDLRGFGVLGFWGFGGF